MSIALVGGALPEGPLDDMTSVFCGNLSWAVTDQDLHNLMVMAGEVVEARVIRYPDGRSKGWGLIEFASPEAAAEAIIKFTDYDLSGRKIFLREDREKGGPGTGPPSTFGAIGEPAGGKGGGKGKGRGRGRGRGRGGDGFGGLPAPDMGEVVSGTALFVGNLPWTTADADLYSVFSSYNVTHAEVKMGYDGRSRGYGIVRFNTEADAAAAIRHNGMLIGDRELAIRYDRQTPE